MKPDWRSDLSICAAGFTAERIGHNLRGESIYRNDIVIAVGTAITDRPRTDPYVRVYAYGSSEGWMA